MQEPKISKDLRNLMNENLDLYPQGMICTGLLARSKPHNIVHTTFGGFSNQEDFSSSLSNSEAQRNFSTLCDLFSDKQNIQLMNELILNGPRKIDNKNLTDSLINLEIIESYDDKFEITAKGRIFILATYSIVS